MTGKINQRDLLVGRSETARGSLQTGVEPAAPSAPRQSSPGMTRRDEAPVPPHQEQQLLQMPSGLPQQSSRTAFQGAVCPKASDVEREPKLPLSQSERLRLFQRRLDPELLEMRAARAKARKPRHGAFVAALHQRGKRVWNNWKATSEVLGCLVRGESPASVKPCGRFVLTLYRLRTGGRS